ncbi:MAG: serine protease, partial [Frankiaceae bacterium]
MHDHSVGRRTRRALVLVALGGLLTTSATSLALSSTASAAAGGQTAAKLTKHDRELLAGARADGASTVTMLIAAQPGQGSTVASGLASLGATVRYRDDDVSYLRARVPIGKADAVSKLAGIQTANLDETVALDDPAADPGTDPEAVPAPGAGTPDQNPYLPTQDIGAPQFVASHPTYDGRGVRIGILDTGVDLLTPELQTAKDLAGNTVPKVADWITYTDPVDDNDPTWLDMSRQVTASGGTFTADGTTYAVPADGTYRFAVLNERDPRLGGELGNDLNRDGNPAGSSGLFAVLWSTASNSVWVDTDQDGSFADQAAMTDYAVHHDMGTFGTDRPATAERDSVPFVVQTDGKDKYVNIGIVSG